MEAAIQVYKQDTKMKTEDGKGGKTKIQSEVVTAVPH